jgi:putative tryptophan/tyrosine transport system substrate-binding protein
MPDVEEAARSKGIQLSVLEAGTETEIDAAFASLVRLRADALLVGSDPVFNTQRERFVSLASRHAVPAMYEFREYVELGGLASYGPNLGYFLPPSGFIRRKDSTRRKAFRFAGSATHQIELVINLRTAKALGLMIPTPLLARADEVIE